MRLQRLNTTSRGCQHFRLHLPTANCSLPPPTSCFPSPSTSCFLSSPTLYYPPFPTSFLLPLPVTPPTPCLRSHLTSCLLSPPPPVSCLLPLPASSLLPFPASHHLPLPASHPSVFVHSSDLAGGHPDLVGVEGQAGEESTGHHRTTNRRAEAESRDLPLDTVGVSQVVSLRALLVVEEDDHGGDEVDNLPGGQQVDVGPAVFAPVAVPDIRQSRTYLLTPSKQKRLFVPPRPTAAIKVSEQAHTTRRQRRSVLKYAAIRQWEQVEWFRLDCLYISMFPLTRWPWPSLSQKNEV